MYNVNGKNFTSILKMQDYVREKYAQPGKKIFFVPVAAFGIAYSAYIDSDTEDQRSFSMENHVCNILYN